MIENVDPPLPEGVGNDGGINPPPIDHAPHTPSRYNRRNTYGISRGKHGGKSKSHWETSVVADSSAKAAAPPEVDMAHDDLHGIPEDDTESQMRLELTENKVKSL